MLRVVVLISGGGSNLRALLERCDDPAFPAHVVAVGADRDAAGLVHADEFGVPSFSVPFTAYPSRQEWGAALLEAIRPWAPDLVVLSGLMRLLPAEVVDALGPALINTHPAYLPEFPGAHAVRDALDAGAERTGASVIVVDHGCDSGPVLARERVPVLPGDTEATLHDRIKPVERRLLAEVVEGVATGRIDLKETRVTTAPESASPRDLVPVRRALLSVSDKSGLAGLGAALAAAGVELVSTGSTAATLRAAGLAVTEVAEVTGFPESLDGRVKTLHPAVHAGLLADLRRPEHGEQLAGLGIAPFELVVSSLYPFEETVASGADDEGVVEQIDIGGPAMVRAAAKNFANVAVVTDPADYAGVQEALAAGGTRLEQRRALAATAFERIARYDRAIADWFASGRDDAVRSGEHRFVETPLRYGENAHQTGALLREPDGHGLAQADQLHGKELSFNNMVDADAAVRAALDHEGPAVAIMKHANPCGIAVAPPHAVDPIAAAHRLANDCDPVSAFGGVIAANREVTLGMAEAVAGIFTEVIVAPGYQPEALTVLQQKKNIRILRLPEGFALPETEFKQVSGGVLVQQPDRFGAVDPAGWRLAAGPAADEATLADLVFAWRACRAVKSNAILLASGGASVGIGMGQVNRVDSCHLAVRRAGDRARGSVAASDAFFPFADGPEVLLRAGVKAIVQPGGSVRDDEVIAAVEAAGVTMYLTGERHFFH